MSEAKGCLGWTGATIAWILLWGLCLSIANTNNISPFGVLLIIIGGTLILVFLVVVGILLYIHTREKNYLKHKNRVGYIANNYSLAYHKYIEENHIKRDGISLSDLKMIGSREDALWHREENLLREEQEKRNMEWREKCQQRKEKADSIIEKYPDGAEYWGRSYIRKGHNMVTNTAICDAEEEIITIDKHIKTEKWEKKQYVFTGHCYNISKKFLANYGRYFYYVPFMKLDAKGNEIGGSYKVWQSFYASMCQETLDYKYFPYIKEHNSSLPGLKNRARYFPTPVYATIAKFIKELSESYCKGHNDRITVLFNYDKDWSKESLHFHYKPLLDILSSEEYKGRITCKDTSLLDKYDVDEVENIRQLSDDAIVIFDIFTENAELEKLCRRIISCGIYSRPVITYISLLKAYDRNEMSDLIEKENNRQAIIQEERWKEEQVKKKLLEATSSWDTLDRGLHYSYLFYYYPTTCGFEATEEEWDNRWIIWDFKNTPGKTTADEHEEALGKVIPMVKHKLLLTFEAANLKHLTFVCIPASSQVKTKARYEEFSNRICGELGMINAYPHITVQNERLERHLGGTSTDTSQLHFDEDFFKGKYVLLFDDVITRGDSMRTFKWKMEELGARVVGGLSLGKTKHERPIKA